MNEEKTKEMDELINCLDDLPHLMDKIKAETANTTRYSITGPNYSYSVGMALNGQDPKERNAYQMQRMAFQAKKVLERLSALPKSTSINKKTVQDNARTAKETLLKYKKSGIDLKSFYKQYDTTRSGNLTYKDFSDILLSMSTGIGREDAMFLARSMDKNKTGYLNYNKILDSLEQVEKSEKAMKVPGASSTAPSDKTPLSIEAYSYSNRDDVSRPFTESKSAEVSPAGSVASQKRVTFIDENNADETQRMMKRIISLDPSNSKVDTHPEVPVESPQDILSREFGSTGRRFFWNNPQTAVTRRLKEREAPYYVEMTLDEKKEIKKKRRSSSAPPRASSTSAPSSPAGKKALSVYLRSQDDNIDVESSEEVPEITPTNRASLKNVLNRNNSTDSLTRASKEDSRSGLKLHNPVTETRTILTERHQLIEETEKIVLENNLIRQIGGKYENLKHIMKNQDHSKSGTINLQEFKRSLTRLGVQLNQHQMDSLFANYLTQTSADETNRRLTPKEHFIYNDQSNQSFFNTSSINISDKEKVIPIDTVLERLQQRAKAHAFEHIRKDINVQGEKLDIFLQENEKLKISKKILNQMNRTPNPNHIFESLYPSNHGFLTPSQLTKSLQTMGTDIQSKEIETIVNELPKGPKGEISLQQFHQSLIKQTQEIMQKTDQRKKEHYNINNHPRYGATYRSNIQLGESGNEYYNNNKNDIISQTKLNNGDSNSLLSQKEKKEWSKLQNHLQRSYPKILKVFSDKEILQSLGKNENLEKQNQISNTIEEQYLQPITVEQLQKRLSKEGIHLGQDDTERLQKQIYSKLYQENRLRNSLTSSLSSSFDDGKKNNTEITMDDFCEVVGIPIRRYDNTNRVELMDKHESKVSDVGVFESSKNSVHHNATSTTSIFFENDDTVRERYFGKQTRKPPLPLSVYSKDPSKFWDMPKSNDNPMAFPYPLPSTRPSAPFQSANTSTTLAKINEKGIRRGIVSLNDKPQALAGGGGPKLTMEALLKANNQPLSRVVTNDGSFVIKGGSGSSGVLIGGGGGTSANYAENPLRNSHAVNTSQSTILNESSNLVINDDSMAVDASHLTAPSNMSPFVTPTDVGRHRRGRGRRSSSAPPRSGSNHSQGGYSNDEYDGYSSNTGSIASATSSARSDRGGNVNSRRINADELSQHIAKWSNNTLADYYNKALSTGTGPAVLVTGGAKTVSSKGKSVDHYDSQDSTISPSSYHSASTISRGTVNFNKKPVAIMGGGGKKSVRDDFDSSAAVATMKTGAAAAPFANDLQR